MCLLIFLKTALHAKHLTSTSRAQESYVIIVNNSCLHVVIIMLLACKGEIITRDYVTRGLTMSTIDNRVIITIINVYSMFVVVALRSNLLPQPND